MRASTFAVVAATMLLTTTATAQPPESVSQTSPSRLTSLGAVEVPRLGEILQRRQELGLSGSQVQTVEKLALEIVRETIRRQADLMIAQLDLEILLDPPPTEEVDVAKAEVKFREIEWMRTDLRLALVRAIEAAKGALTPDQRAKLGTAMTAGRPALSSPPGPPAPPDPPDLPGKSGPRGQSPSAVILVRGAPGHAPSGGGASRPGGGSAPHVPPPSHRPAPGTHFDVHRHYDRGPHARFFVGPSFSFWWDPYWTYAPPPVYSTPPPQAYWYYCPSLGTYYPTAPNCPDPWVPVPIS